VLGTLTSTMSLNGPKLPNVLTRQLSNFLASLCVLVVLLPKNIALRNTSGAVLATLTCVRLAPPSTLLYGTYLSMHCCSPTTLMPRVSTESPHSVPAAPSSSHANMSTMVDGTIGLYR